MLRLTFVVLLIALRATEGHGALTKRQLVELAKQKVEANVLRALVERDCVDFELNASDVAELSPLVPAEVLEAAIKCRRPTQQPQKDQSDSSFSERATGKLDWSAYVPAIGQTLFLKLGDSRSEVEKALVGAGFEFSESKAGIKCSQSTATMETCEVWSTDAGWTFSRPESLASTEGFLFGFKDDHLFELTHFMLFGDRATTLAAYRNLRAAVTGVYKTSPGRLGFFARKMMSALLPLGSIEDTGVWKSPKGTALVLLLKQSATDHTIAFMSTLEPLD